MTKYTLVITEEAEYDLNNLYVDSFRRWGEAQADKYYDNLLAHFNAICDNPYLYPAVDEIRKGYRRGVCGKHSVFYLVAEDRVEVMALLKHENRYF